jgi:hypothetical protein
MTGPMSWLESEDDFPYIGDLSLRPVCREQNPSLQIFPPIIIVCQDPI